MADLDQDLPSRLSRLAAAVPVLAPGQLDPVHRGAVVARQRVRMAWATPLVVLAVGTLVAGVLQVGPFATGSVEPNGPVESTARSGDFELTIRSEKAVYAADEAIQITGTLTYRGSQGVTIEHALGEPREGCCGGGPLGFGVVEPVIGSLILSPVWPQSRNSTTLVPGGSVASPFQKVAAWSGDDPRSEDYRAFLAEPELRLSAGTWHPYVVAEFGTSMRAELEIGVSPPTSSPPPSIAASGPVTQATRSGDFELVIRSAKSRYEAGEAIDIVAALNVVGTGPVEIAHAFGARGSPLGFGIVEPVLGDLRLGPAWDLACATTTLNPGFPLTQPFWKSGGWTSAHPRADEYHRYIVDPELRLPEGIWHVYAVAEFSVGACGAAPIRMRVDIVVEVAAVPGDGPALTPAPSVASRDSWKSTSIEGNFELRLEAAKPTFGSGEPLDVVASLVYRGLEERITISHLTWGPLSFGMWAPGIVLAPRGRWSCSELELQRDVPLTESLVDLGSGGTQFGVPHGLHVITATAEFHLGRCAASDRTIETSIVVAVADGPDDIPLVTDVASQQTACLLMRGGGELVTSEMGMGIVDFAGKVRQVVWPIGYSAHREADGAVLVGRDGQVIAHTGDQVVFDAIIRDDGRPIWPCGEVEVEASFEP